MLPLFDNIPTRRLAVVSYALIAATCSSGCGSSASAPDAHRPLRVLSVRRRGAVRRPGARPPAVGRGHGLVDVPARELAAPAREHALPLDLRQQRRGRDGPLPLPRLLLRGRVRRRARADGRDAAVLGHGGREHPDDRRERRDRRRPRRVLRAPPPRARRDAALRLPARAALGDVLPRRLVRLPALAGRLLAHASRTAAAGSRSPRTWADSCSGCSPSGSSRCGRRCGPAGELRGDRRGGRSPSCRPSWPAASRTSRS